MVHYLKNNLMVMRSLARHLGMRLNTANTQPARANTRQRVKPREDKVATDRLRVFFGPHNRAFTDLVRTSGIHVIPRHWQFPSGEAFFHDARLLSLSRSSSRKLRALAEAPRIGGRKSAFSRMHANNTSSHAHEHRRR
mmetsp:Transcript_1796/g.5044  ORF Transcript_1796/g.5044 Transcript_1796/m.5044 type:complete len:138 (-) Transcript_1796:151-564(-)